MFYCRLSLFLKKFHVVVQCTLELGHRMYASQRRPLRTHGASFGFTEGAGSPEQKYFHRR